MRRSLLLPREVIVAPVKLPLPSAQLGKQLLVNAVCSSVSFTSLATAGSAATATRSAPPARDSRMAQPLGMRHSHSTREHHHA